MRMVLDLYSGSQSLKKPSEEAGFEYYSIDMNYDADMQADMMTLEVKDIPVVPYIVWASPPCPKFSIAAVSRHWHKFQEGAVGHYFPKHPDTVIATNLMLHTIEVIKELKPRYWYIENPRSVLRKMIFMRSLPRRVTVTYCQYGDTRMKPTDIWTNNLDWVPKPMCKNGDPCHEAAPRGSRTGTQGMNRYEASKVPYDLLTEILAQGKDK